MSRMTLAEAFTIPDVITADDFVLQLNTGVQKPEQTVSEYVVTDSLAQAFDSALDHIRSALTKGTSQGAFIHGSFGSGKSHFMAVLDLILRGSSQARALPGLQPTISRHQDVLSKRLLTVEYHLIGESSLESALFSGYLQAIARSHPEATPPVLHKSDLLLKDALARMQAGPESFFEQLNSASGGDGGWGDFGGGWDEQSFLAAAQAPVGDPDRDRLVTDLMTTMFQGYKAAGEWLDVSAGLAAMTAHAKGLGYEGLVLFLDELVLWLASHLADSNFVSVEGSKVAKLVEQGVGQAAADGAGHAGRAIPVISFVARQRDLQDFLGERAAAAGGAEKMAIGETFRWWEDRFDRINLEAADLPKIAHRRLLQPRSEEARQAIESALATVKRDRAAFDVLLTGEQTAGETEFAEVYPFSPALVDTLIVLAPMMQRERTALKVMAQLLVNGKDTLVVDDIIPAGDLYEVVVTEGSNPLTPEIRAHFENARSLYDTKIRPMLLDQHNLTDEQAKHVDRNHPFSRDDRLVRTLLMSALAPGVKALGNLNAQRLAALNHGTVRTRVPGNEVAVVNSQVRQWAETIGEISMGEGDNPVISLDLSGVDYDSILERVANEDNEGARRRLLKQMLFEQLGVIEDNNLYSSASFSTVWRGSKRAVDVVFGNIRDASELPDNVFQADGDSWRIVFDFPFDEPGHSPQDDRTRMESLASVMQSRTVAWMPGFLTAARLEDLGLLVRLEYLLAGTGQHFSEHAQHLPPEQRPIAKEALENRRSAVRARLVEVLKQAYGAATPEPADIDSSFGELAPFASLLADFDPQAPVGADLGKAMENLVHQMLDQQYPDHPRFDPGTSDVTNANIAVVLEYVKLATEREGRVDPIETSKRAVLRRVANPLGCGQAFENHYVFDAAHFPWRNRFTKRAAQDGLTEEVAVSRIWEWLTPTGMSRELQNLLILAWALLDDKEFARHGATVPVTTGRDIREDFVLRNPVLPTESAWVTARQRAQSVLGETPPVALTAANVRSMASAVRARAGAWKNDSVDLLKQLRAHESVLGLDDAHSRMVDALLASDLLTRLAAEDDDLVVVNALAEATLPSEPQSVATSISSARGVLTALKGASWTLLEPFAARADTSDDVQAQQIIAALREAARASEMHKALEPVLVATARAVSEVLIAERDTTQPTPVTPEPQVPVPAPPDTPHDTVTAQRHRVDAIELEGVDGTLQELRDSIADALRDNAGRAVRIEWWLE